MRHSASWMSIWDDRILEYIREEGSGKPKQLDDAGYLRVSKAQISRRLKRLAEHDLLKPLGGGVYIITDRGEAYLDGRYDAENCVFLDEEGHAAGATPPEDWSASEGVENGT